MHSSVRKWKVVDPLVAPSRIRHLFFRRKIARDLPLLAPGSYSVGAQLHLATPVPLVGSEEGTVLPTGIQKGCKIIARGVKAFVVDPFLPPTLCA